LCQERVLFLIHNSLLISYLLIRRVSPAVTLTFA
jgi:hypothetical protein